MNIDFKLLKAEEDLEFLCRDLFQAHGATIISHPSRGPDGKKDLLIETLESDAALDRSLNKRTLVQCKHKAVSGRSVAESELGDVRSACQRWKVRSYLLVTTTVPSTTVSANFDAINQEGDYECDCWDHRRLERKILSGPSAHSLLERYSLQESLDTVFLFVRTVLEAEANLPYRLSHETVGENYKGIVCISLEDGDEHPAKTGFIAAIDDIGENEIETLKSEQGLKEIVIVKPGISTDSTMSLPDFYDFIASIKDEWYQDAICKLALCSPQNPTPVRILESCIKHNPYGARQSAKDLVADILQQRGQGLDFMLVLEAMSTAVRFGWKDLREDIFAWIECVRASSESKEGEGSQQAHSAVVKRIASDLGRLDKEERAFFDRIVELFSGSRDIQFKADLIEYFMASQNPDSRKLLEEFSAKNGQTEVFPTNNGVFYSSKGVRFMFNSAPWNVSKYVDSYLRVIQSE